MQGPGCLNYSLILRIADGEAFQSIAKTNCYVMTRHKEALQSLLGTAVEIEGFTDLAIGCSKFSGNAQRRGRRFVLFHGTFLLQFDLGLMAVFLPLPSRQPEYRKNRAHTEFLMNLNIGSDALKDAMVSTWGARERFTRRPWERIERLARDKYSADIWTSKF